MEIVNKYEKEFEEELKKKNIPYLIRYFNYFNGAGGYRNFWIKDLEGESVLFEIERFENPINQTFKVYFVAYGEKYKLIYDADKKEWIRENLEYYNEEEDE